MDACQLIEQVFNYIYNLFLNGTQIPQHLLSWAVMFLEMIENLFDTNLILFEDGSHRQK